MFTGIVEERGEVVAVRDLGDAVRLTVRGRTSTAGTRAGDSVAVNGCCLTVVTPTADTFQTDVMRESLERTSLGALVPGAAVNLERAVPVTGRLGGHLVQGHVDGTARLVSRTPSAHWDVLCFALEPRLSRYVASKGSITVDGVSLTVVDVTGVEVADGDQPTFSVSLVPTTLVQTTLGGLRVGARVNIEVDVVAKYVERLLQARAPAPGGVL